MTEPELEIYDTPEEDLVVITGLLLRDPVVVVEKATGDTHIFDNYQHFGKYGIDTGQRLTKLEFVVKVGKEPEEIYRQALQKNFR